MVAALSIVTVSSLVGPSLEPESCQFWVLQILVQTCPRPLCLVCFSQKWAWKGDGEGPGCFPVFLTPEGPLRPPRGVTTTVSPGNWLCPRPRLRDLRVPGGQDWAAAKASSLAPRSPGITHPGP